METFANLLLAGRKACHHLAVGQVRRCGVCSRDAEIGAIDMPPGYEGRYRPLCCRPICVTCIKTTKPLVRVEAAQVHSEVSDLEAILKTSRARQKSEVKI